MDTVTIVAKGPSAVHAQQYIDACNTDVAVINESGLLLREDQKIDFAFFTHSGFIPRMATFLHRVQMFSGPSQYSDCSGISMPEKYPENLPDYFPKERHHPYMDYACCGDRQSMIDRIVSGGIVHHHTTTGAHHWLVKRGYKRVRIIGVDGGIEYASGMQGNISPSIDLDDWKRIHIELSDLLHLIYGAYTEWWG